MVQDRPEMDNQRLLTALLEHLADGLLITDPNGLVMLTNRALERMVGRPGATLLGKPLPADLAPGIGPIIGQALETAPAPAWGEIVWNDGRRIQVRASVFEAEAGAVIGVVTTLRDVSRHRAAEQVKDTVLTAISHELRTPLAAIVGFVALANKTLHERLAPHVSTGPPEAQRALTRIADHLQRIEESGRRLEGMVNGLLDLADLEAGRAQWDMADVSLLDVIHAALSSVVAQAEAKGLPVHLSLAPDLPAVRGDRTRLIQVVTHLLGNAIKFTDQGEVRIAVKTLKVDEEGLGGTSLPLPPGDYSLVSVADTGPGIPSETLPHLFEKFFQLSDSLTDKPPGMGLGLALCREIIEYHGGKIWAESEPGVGSMFSFALPYHPQARLADPVLRRELRRWLAATAPATAAPPKVLLALAGAGLQRLLIGDFSREASNFLLAPDGQTCCRILQSEAPSLLVLDPFLPGLDVLRGLDLPPTLLLGVVQTDDERLRVALGEAMPELIGVDLALRSLRSYLALAWDDGQPEGRILILDAGAPSLGGITETLRAQGFQPVVSRPADIADPDQAVLEAALALLRPVRVQGTTHYRNPQRALCTLVLVEF